MGDAKALASRKTMRHIDSTTLVLSIIPRTLPVSAKGKFGDRQKLGRVLGR